MAARTGLPTVKEKAEFLCGFLAVYIPIIIKHFPNETALIAGLELLASAACAVVVLADEVIVLGD